MMTKKIRNGLVALILAMSWFVASGASAWSDETRLESVAASSRTLVLEDNITVRASDQTEIRDNNGVRIDFSEIPVPVDVAPAVVMVKVDGVRSGNVVQATKILVRPLLAY